MLTIWGRTNSINVQKVLWCCAELGLAYKRTDAGGAHGVTNTPEYLAMNPNALVPTIDDDGFVLWESNAIVRYLAAKHGEGTLYPLDLRQRAEADRWMDWQVTTLWTALRPLFFGYIRTPPEQRDAAALAAAQRSAEQALTILDRYLDDRVFLAGERVTMGDIPVGISVYRWFALPIERPDFPQVARWYSRLTERPGFQTHVMHPLS
jgi:glutathione S-transferase